MNTSNQDVDNRYQEAAKRVKKIKGFYIHLIVYILVNSFIICGNYFLNDSTDKTFFSWHTFSTAFFWGIGLFSHGISVFGRNLFFSENWEQKKINEFMEKEKQTKNSWE